MVVNAASKKIIFFIMAAKLTIFPYMPVLKEHKKRFAALTRHKSLANNISPNLLTFNLNRIDM